MCILLGLFLWRTLTNTLSLLSHCSNCPRLRPRKLLQVDSSGSLFPVTRWYSRFMMYYLCTSPEMNHFSKEPWSLFTEEWSLRTKNWASAGLVVTGVLSPPGPLSGDRVGNMCMSVPIYLFLDLPICTYVFITKFILMPLILIQHHSVPSSFSLFLLVILLCQWEIRFS